MNAHCGESSSYEGSRGFDVAHLERVRRFCREATERGEIPGCTLAVARHGAVVLNEAWGLAGEDRPATPETVWLIASVTKPVVAAGVCLLIDRGEVAVDDPVSRYLPDFAGEDRAEVRVRHLLTHTSGLPDMLPENFELRRRHASLEEFVCRIATTPLLFPPGTDVSYQSTGIALLGAIIERVTGSSCREFLRREFFLLLGMTHTALGWRPEFAERAATCRLPPEQTASDWDWNSPYWREFGAPWGGMYSTAPEYLRFLQMLLRGGEWEGRCYFSPAMVREMTGNRTADLPHLFPAARLRSTWGYGWRSAAGRESEYLGDLVSRGAYGHAGATGTGVWNDPETGVSMVFFSNQPGIGRFIGLLSNQVAAAVR